jgi:hypothetical protein
MNDIILVNTCCRFEALYLDVQTDTGWTISINLVLSLALGSDFFVVIVNNLKNASQRYGNDPGKRHPTTAMFWPWYYYCQIVTGSGQAVLVGNFK